MNPIHPDHAYRRLALLLVLGLVLLAAPWIRYALEPNPQSLTERLFGADVHLTTDRSLLIDPTRCIAVGWEVEGIREVRINGQPVVGMGESSVCGVPPRLSVTFQNGAIRIFQIDRQFVLTSETRLGIGVGAALMILAVGLFIAGRLHGNPGQRVTQSRKQSRWGRDAAALWNDGRAWIAIDDRRYGWVLLVILIAGVGLRLSMLSQPLRHDEVNTYFLFASQSLGDALSSYNIPNNHLFHTLLVYITTRLFGDAEWALRLPAFLAGVLMIPTTYLAGRALSRSTIGLISSAFVAGSSILILFSANARGYSLIALLFLLLIPLARYLSRSPNLVGWTLLAVLAALGFYTIPVMLYPFGTIALWLLILVVRRNRGSERGRLLVLFVLSMIAGAGLTLLLYLPVFLREGVASVTENQYVASLLWTTFTRDVGNYLPDLWRYWMEDIPIVLVMVLAAGILVCLIACWRRPTTHVPLLAVLSVLWVGSTMTVQRVLPPLRVFTYVLPLIFMVGVTGLDWVVRQLFRPMKPRCEWAWASAVSLIVVAVLGAMVIESRSPLIRDDGGVLAEAPTVSWYLKDVLQPYDQVIVAREFALLRYYFEHDEMDKGYLRTDRRESPYSLRRLYVIVQSYEAFGETLRINLLNEAMFYPPEVVFQDGSVTVYRTYRRVIPDDVGLPSAL